MSKKNLFFSSFIDCFYSFLCCPCRSVHVVCDFSGCRVNRPSSQTVHNHGKLNGKIGKRCRRNREDHTVEEIHWERDSSWSQRLQKEPGPGSNRPGPETTSEETHPGRGQAGNQSPRVWRKSGEAQRPPVYALTGQRSAQLISQLRRWFHSPAGPGCATDGSASTQSCERSPDQVLRAQHQLLKWVHVRESTSLAGYWRSLWCVVAGLLSCLDWWGRCNCSYNEFICVVC